MAPDVIREQATSPLPPRAEPSQRAATCFALDLPGAADCEAAALFGALVRADDPSLCCGEFDGALPDPPHPAVLTREINSVATENLVASMSRC